MTKSEVIMLRNYIKGAYGYDNGGESTDAVWFDLLQEYEYKGIMQAAKNHIKSGNNYPPRVAELIKGYETILDDFNSDIIERMTRDGVFDDPAEITITDLNGNERTIKVDEETRQWNNQSRITKAKVWLSAKSMPSWFKAKYEQYRTVIRQGYFGQNNVKMLGDKQ